jgi:hypothetical protein
MTAVQQMFLEWCIGYMKFRIADAMSVGLMSLEAERYDALWTMLQGAVRLPCDDMIETGRRLFPDAPNAPEGSGLRRGLRARVYGARRLVAELRHPARPGVVPAGSRTAGR